MSKTETRGNQQIAEETIRNIYLFKCLQKAAVDGKDENVVGWIRVFEKHTPRGS